MRVHVESETKIEGPVDAKTVEGEAGEKRLDFRIEVKHYFGVRVADPAPNGWSPANHFNVPAAMLPPSTQCGDEFDVFFERAKQK